MKIISWNLNHRTIEKPIPDSVLKFFIDFKPDIIMLNEFIDGDSRISFKEKLTELGFHHQLTSPKIGKHNQVFCASKTPINLGDIHPPSISKSAETNFLHIKLLESEIELVGFRAPSYKKSQEKALYWKEFSSIVSNTKNRKIIFIGDMNYDPFSGIAATSKEIQFDLNGKFKIPNPIGEWSFISINGKNKTRIDHSIVAEKINIESAEYCVKFNNNILAGSRHDSAITDHAVLCLNIKD